MISTIQKFHHLDSLILDKIKASSEKGLKDIEKEIEKFESKYSVKSFVKHLKQECRERREIERSKRESKQEFGNESYDAQRIIVETEIERYVSNMNSRITHIKKHIHHLPTDVL